MCLSAALVKGVGESSPAKAGQIMDTMPERFAFDARMPRIEQHSGYTAIELMAVIALIAIMIAVALPHFSALMDRWRVHQAIVHLQNVIRFASIQAIRTNSGVVIRAKPATCRQVRDDHNWSCGLTVFQDTNQSHTQDAGVPTLHEMQEFHALTVMHVAGNGQIPHLRYGSYGTPIAAQGRFEVFPLANSASPAAQTICMSSGGRMRVKPGVGPC